MKENNYAVAYSDFWDWFKANSKKFASIVKQRENIEEDFFDSLSEELLKIREGFWFLVGELDDGTIDLIFTAEGAAHNIVFIEELVDAAPSIEGWRFTANKPSVSREGFKIEMGGYVFGEDNISFYANEHAQYPDLIDIVFVHGELNEENREQMGAGVCVFLDNYLGELSFLNDIDNLRVVGIGEAEKEELIPVKKLRDYLIWRQKEFVEKYEDSCYKTEEGTYSVFEGGNAEGYPLVAVINTKLLNWENKASHPWLAILHLLYDGSNNNGFPAEEDLQALDKIEAELLELLKDSEGYLYVGRETGGGERSLLFTCRDFRKPAKEFDKMKKKYADCFEIEIEIYKDKYWQGFEHYNA